MQKTVISLALINAALTLHAFAKPACEVAAQKTIDLIGQASTDSPNFWGGKGRELHRKAIELAEKHPHFQTDSRFQMALLERVKLTNRSTGETVAFPGWPADVNRRKILLPDGTRAYVDKNGGYWVPCQRDCHGGLHFEYMPRGGRSKTGDYVNAMLDPDAAARAIAELKPQSAPTHYATRFDDLDESGKISRTESILGHALSQPERQTLIRRGLPPDYLDDTQRRQWSELVLGRAITDEEFRWIQEAHAMPGFVDNITIQDLLDRVRILRSGGVDRIHSPGPLQGFPREETDALIRHGAP